MLFTFSSSEQFWVLVRENLICLALGTFFLLGIIQKPTVILHFKEACVISTSFSNVINQGNLQVLTFC